MITQKVNKCLVRDSIEIRTALNNHLRLFDITRRKLVEDSKSYGCKFSESQLSRYLKHGNVKGSIRVSDIMWLCENFKINITLKILA